MNKLTKDQIIKQIKAIVIYEFLQSYNVFESILKEYFYLSLKEISAETKQELYFIYGSKIATYVEYDPLISKLSEVKYKNNDSFKQLTINQILKLDRTRHFIKAFSIEIQSLQTKAAVYSFHDSAIKLIEMRNILSHELVECVFREKHIIEILSEENISINTIDLISNFDVSLMDDMTKTIYSNYIYMKLMLEKLQENLDNYY